MNKHIKRLTIVLAVLILLFIIAGFIAGNFFFNLALKPDSDKSSVLQAPHNAIERSPADTREQSEREEWFKTNSADRYIQSYDDLRLHGYTIEHSEETSRWAIVCHGYAGHGGQMTKSGKEIYEMGFNILMPDGRGLGESEGTYIGMGWHDRLDIVAWIEEIVSMDEDAEIILYGVSMGGATVMMTSGEDLPVNVKAIVEDCGYTSVWDEFSYQLSEIFGLPSFPVMHFSSLVTQMRAGYFLGEASAVDQVAKSITPTLFIHGSEDTFVPSYMLDIVYEASNAPKEKLLVEGAGHGGAADVLGDAYWDAVADFIFQYVSE